MSTCCLIVTACGDKKSAPKKPEAKNHSRQLQAAPSGTTQKEEIKAEKEVYTYEPKGEGILLFHSRCDKGKASEEKRLSADRRLDVDEISSLL